jgi:hypothetical protein
VFNIVFFKKRADKFLRCQKRMYLCSAFGER